MQLSPQENYEADLSGRQRHESISNKIQMKEILSSANSPKVSRCITSASECDGCYYRLAQKVFCSQPISPQLVQVLISIGIIFGVSILVLLMGVIVSRYLLQSVTHLTRWLQFTPGTMSYIIIPLMNGAPDVINAHLLIKRQSVNLVIGEIIGSNLTSFTIIIGCISILRPFTVENRRALILGFSFICSILILLSYILLDGHITFIECLILTLLYPIHIMLVTFDRQESSESPDLERTLSKDLVAETSHLLVHQDSPREHQSWSAPPYLIWEILNTIVCFFTGVMDGILPFFIPVTHPTHAQPSSTIDFFVQNLRSGFWFHLWSVLISVILINTCFFGLFPGTLIYIVAIAFVVTRGLSSVLSIEASGMLINTLCVMNSLSLMIVITRLVIQLLTNLGNMWGISDYIMGLLVFSLVSCMNDILMNIMLAIECSPHLGVKACMGSCCLLISVGVGLNGLWDLSTVALETHQHITLLSLPVSLTWELYISLLALNSAVMLSFIYMTLNKWRLDRNLGIGLLAVWAFAITLCISIEFK